MLLVMVLVQGHYTLPNHHAHGVKWRQIRLRGNFQQFRFAENQAILIEFCKALLNELIMGLDKAL